MADTRRTIIVEPRENTKIEKENSSKKGIEKKPKVTPTAVTMMSFRNFSPKKYYEVHKTGGESETDIIARIDDLSLAQIICDKNPDVATLGIRPVILLTDGKIAFPVGVNPVPLTDKIKTIEELRDWALSSITLTQRNILEKYNK